MGALTQHRCLLPQGWMQAAASASVSFPKGEVKDLPSTPRAGKNRSLSAGNCLMGRKSHKIPVGSSKH